MKIELDGDFERMVFLTTLVVATKEKLVENPLEPFHTHQMILKIMCQQMKIEFLDLYKKPLKLRVAMVENCVREVYELEYMDLNSNDTKNREEMYSCVKVTRGSKN